MTVEGVYKFKLKPEKKDTANMITYKNELVE